MSITAQQAAQYYAAAGFTGQDLVQMVAIAGRESGYNETAHRTDNDPSKMTGDRGLSQINSVWDAQLKAAGIIQSAQDLFNPAVNAKAAKYVFDHQGWAAWGSAAGGWTKGGNPTYGTDMAAAQAAVNGIPAGQAVAPATPSLPADAIIVRSASGGGAIALFDIGGGVWMRFGIQPSQLQQVAAGRTINTYSDELFNKWVGMSVDGGLADELTSVASTFPSFAAYWESIVTQVMGKNNPALNDPAVRKVLAEFAGRPDMSEAELQNKLKATPYWQTKTEGELEWNSLSEAEKTARRGDAASRMQAAWFQFGGVQVAAGDARIAAKLEDVASGKMSMSQWQEQFLKPRAAEMPESPWARQVRTEQETQRQRPIDIENTVGQLRSTLSKWGLQWSEGQLHRWAMDIVGKKSSDDDFLNTVKDQAMSKYGNWKKNRDMDTATEAAPWVDTYNRVMETQGDVFTPQVQKALNAGTNSYDFEKSLKQAPAWLETKNARNDMLSMAGQVSQMFGYT